MRMSNGQAEIERLEAATSAFEEIITTENDTVEVPNVGTTPSLAKRVNDQFNKRYSGHVVYMQTNPSQLDEYGYPLKTLYENGDGFITYYPEYAVFRKDGGAWEYVTPHLRNVVTFNGTTQYATAPRVSEIDISINVSLAISLKINLTATDNQYLIWQGDNENKIRFALYVFQSKLSLYIGSLRNEIPFVLSEHVDYSIDIDLVNNHARVTINGFEYKAIFGRQNQTIDVETEKLQISGRPDPELSAALLAKGKISDVKIWTGGDRNTGTLTRHYRMNEGWQTDSQILVNHATELSPERLVNGEFDTDLNGWNNPTGAWSWENGTARLDGDGTVQVLQQENVASVAVPYIVTSRYTAEDNDVLFILSGTQLNKNGRKLVWGAESASTQFNVKRGANTLTANLDYISLKLADGYGNYIGLTQASWTEEAV